MAAEFNHWEHVTEMSNDRRCRHDINEVVQGNTLLLHAIRSKRTRLVVDTLLQTEGIMINNPAAVCLSSFQHSALALSHQFLKSMLFFQCNLSMNNIVRISIMAGSPSFTR
jgi:hypothetical protein